MKKPLISVIIPVYNGEKTLFNCLNSVISQDFKDFEIIVVDNNSTDKTGNIIEDFMKKDKRIIYCFEGKVGRGAARNKGINESKGKIIAMTDCDCIVPKNWIRKLTKDIVNKKEKIVMGWEDDIIKNYWTKNIQESNLKQIRAKDKYALFIDTKNFAIESALMKKLMFDPNLKIDEDLDLYLRINERYKIRFRQEIKVGHYHKSNMRDLVNIQINRGFQAYLILKKYKNSRDIKTEPLSEWLSVKYYLLFLPNMIIQIVTSNPRKVFFKLVLGTAWRIGLLKGAIKNLI